MSHRCWHGGWADRFGLLPTDIRRHPELGIVISASGVRKMAAGASDTEQKMKLMAFVQSIAPQPI